MSKSKTNKRIGDAIIASMKECIEDQKNVDGSSYPPLKTRVGKRMILTGGFLRNAFKFKATTDGVVTYISTRYVSTALGQLRYINFIGITDEADKDIDNVMNDYTDDVIDNFIKKHK